MCGRFITRIGDLTWGEYADLFEIAPVEENVSASEAIAKRASAVSTKVKQSSFSFVEAAEDCDRESRFRGNDDGFVRGNDDGFYLDENDQGIEYAPTSTIPVIHHQEGKNQLSFWRWGLASSWPKAKHQAPRFNARAESIDTYYLKLFEKRRCLIPVRGFFEWQEIEGEKKKRKVLIRRKDHRLFSLGGLWTQCKAENDMLYSCSIITTEPNQLIAPVHNRMPLILEVDYAKEWLNPNADSEQLRSTFLPIDSDEYMIEYV